MTFTILYMEIMINFPHSRFLKFSLQLLIAQLGVLCGLSRISDYKHHWSDVLTGLLLGSLIAVLMIDRVLGGCFTKAKAQANMTAKAEEI